MAGKQTSVEGTGILLVTANVGSLFEDVSCVPIDNYRVFVRLLLLRVSAHARTRTHDSPSHLTYLHIHYANDLNVLVMSSNQAL